MKIGPCLPEVIAKIKAAHFFRHGVDRSRGFFDAWQEEKFQLREVNDGII